MDVTFDVENGTPLKEEGIPITKGVGEFSPPINLPITSPSGPLVV